MRGLWRGFLPAVFVYGATYWEDLYRMVFRRAFTEVKGQYNKYFS